MQLPGMVVRRAIKAGLADYWSELTRSQELNPWNDGEADGEPVPGEAEGRSAQEHRAEGQADKAPIS